MNFGTRHESGMRTRMSPFTALFLGASAVGVSLVGAITIIGVRGMSVLDGNASRIIALAGDTFDGLPEIIDSLPPALADMIDDKRAPQYASNIDVDVRFVTNERLAGVRPALVIHNRGESLVSLLALRVAALDQAGSPVSEWTEVVATPLAIDDEWRGPLMPGATRHVLLSSIHRVNRDVNELTASVEIADIRVWESDGRTDDFASRHANRL